MDFLRLYLGDLTSLFVLLVVISILAAIAARLSPEQRLIRQIRNWVLIGVIVVFVLGLVPTFVVNNTPRGRVDRKDVDQTQRDFEQRHSGENR